MSYAEARDEAAHVVCEQLVKLDELAQRDDIDIDVDDETQETVSVLRAHLRAWVYFSTEAAIEELAELGGQS